MKRFMILLCVAAVVGLAPAAANAAVTIDTVAVGNAGNAADTTGFGSVAYAYNIGTYEVTAGQYTAFLNAVATTADTYGLYNTAMWSNSQGCKIARTVPAGDPGTWNYSVAPGYANRPVNYVSWGDAARFTNWLHNGQPAGAQGAGTTETGAYTLNGAITNEELMAVSRNSNWKWAITSEDEWYKAAYYKGGSTSAGYFDYPTSSDAVPGRDMADTSGNNANFYSGGAVIPIDSPYYTTVAGEFQNSDSPYGTFDQGGNVWEWNEGLLANSARRGLRGSAFNWSEPTAGTSLQAAYRNYSGVPTVQSQSIGFRVSNAVPEPATIIIWSLFGTLAIGLGWWRKRKAVFVQGGCVQLERRTTKRPAKK